MSYLVLSCGSQARGDSNPESDHDYVCLHDERETPFELINNRYPHISFLSLDAVARMKEKGALFITHLDIDGHIEEGNEEIFKNIHGYKPSDISLSKSIDETRKFIKKISWLPNSREGFLWFCDVMFVALRNIMYCENALRSSYYFGYIDAAVAFGVTDSEIETLLKIRNGKYLYRRDSLSKDQGLYIDLETALPLVKKISGLDTEINFGGKTKWLDDWDFNYWDERIIERAIINKEISDDGFREMLKDHNYNRRVLVESLKKRINLAQQTPTADAAKSARR